MSKKRRPSFSLVRFTAIAVLTANLAASPAFANYQAAQQLMARRDYVGAAAQYFQSYSTPKSGQEKVFSEWGLGVSLKSLGFFYSASKFFSNIVRRGPGPNNPYFRRALVELATINGTVALGHTHIMQLVKGAGVAPENIPGQARGFYFYYIYLFYYLIFLIFFWQCQLFH